MQRAMWRASRLAAVVLTVGLAGCASMTEQQCIIADWHDQGVRDGQSGWPRTRIGDHHEACAKAGVVPNDAQYLAGWAKGIPHFCTPQNGEQVGLHGRPYHQSCPAEMQPAFMERYSAGRRVYLAQEKLDRLNKEIERKESEFLRQKDQKARERLRVEMRRLERQLPDARRSVYAAERHLYR